jgi:hypothetical protein
MITLRAIKGTAPNECRYYRLGESYDFCMWASETGGERAFEKRQVGSKQML